MLGVAGILVQELVHPEIFWYESGLPQNIPGNPLIGDPVNPGGLLAWEFVLMHFVEVLRWQDYRNPGSVNRDPIFTNNAVTNPETGENKRYRMCIEEKKGRRTAPSNSAVPIGVDPSVTLLRHLTLYPTSAALFLTYYLPALFLIRCMHGMSSRRGNGSRSASSL